MLSVFPPWPMVLVALKGQTQRGGGPFPRAECMALPCAFVFAWLLVVRSQDALAEEGMFDRP